MRRTTIQLTGKLINSMRLIIAEKPSLARAIAQALHPLPQQKSKTAIQCQNNVVVSWCIGHLLELAPPEHYSPLYKQWRFDTLPILPEKFQHVPRKSSLSQLNALSRLIKQAKEIVHAGDPDREGQLLVDEVLHYLDWEGMVERLLINDLTPAAVKRALSSLKHNSEFELLSASAAARQRADWLFGMNMTRAMTLAHQSGRAQSKNGKSELFSVGRVQTPVLGLVVKRDETINQFVSHDYFTLHAWFNPNSALTPINQHAIFKGTWQAPEHLASEIVDEEQRIIQRQYLENIAVKFPPTQTAPILAEVISVDKKRKNLPPPLPYSLSTLQIDAARKFGYSAQQTLDICQSLYEKFQLITYPRSDSRYLPTEQYADRFEVMSQLSSNDPALGKYINNCDMDIRSRAWNDKKVEAHHAIIPTLKHHEISQLGIQSRNIFRLVARNYLTQFYPNKLEDETLIIIEATQETFKSSGKVVQQEGWAIMFRPTQSKKGVSSNNDQNQQSLPPLKKGDNIYLENTDIKLSKTTPPSHFDDASLLSAMANIARFVKDQNLRKTLRETDGLGTEATRAGIIETLFKRQYLTRNNKTIRATPKGVDLIHSVPEALAQPDMTAVWEATLDTIRSGTQSPKQFIQTLGNQVTEIIKGVSTALPTPVKINSTKTKLSHSNLKAPLCPQCKATMLLREGKFGQFWACPHYPSCSATLAFNHFAPKKPDNKLDNTATSNTKKPIPEPPIPCPKCHAPLVRRKTPKGFFWGCSNYPSCKQTLPDNKGKPVIHKVPPI